MASTFLYRTNGTPSGTTKYTVSCWLKRSGLSATQYLFNNYTDSNNSGGIWFDTSDRLNVVDELAGSTHLDLTTTSLYRDVSGWYNIVVSVDTTQGVEANRCKIYVNGTQLTSFDTATYPSSSVNLGFQQATAGDSCRIGATFADADYLNGLMSHVHYCDGFAYSASDFGSTDSDTGEWTINTSPAVSYGDNGYFVIENGAVMTDSSPNSNNFAKNGAGTFTNTEDCPSNVFATMNKLDSYWPTTGAVSVFTYGNNQVVSGTGSSSANGYSYNNATIAVSKGKFYWEVKATSVAGSSFVGIISESQIYNQNLGEILNSKAYAYSVQNSNGNLRNNNTTAAYAASFTTNDIISVALDLDNNKIYWAKNGDWSDGSGSWDSSTFDAAVGDIAITAPASTGNGQYFPTVGGSDYSVASSWQPNFGNGYFGITAISSAGTNASDIGKFEYDVPTGFTALSTKGLQE